VNLKIRHILFDLDGTLIDSSRGVVEAVNYSLKKIGAPQRRPEEIKRFIGYPLSEMYPHFSDAPVAELYAYFREKADTSVPDATVALPGADQTVRALRRQGRRLAIATTKVRRNVDEVLVKLNWQGLFDATVSGDEVARVKPAPDAFLIALERLGGSPVDSIAVGDTINDIAAAKAVPMPVIAVKCPYGETDGVQALNPDYSITTISELLNILG
jgi:2-phosphoglycolate phosphatase